MTALVATSQLSMDYGAGPALAPLDLTVDAGERVSLIGHNGSGKTTLLRILVGLLEPTGGVATVGGHPAGSLAARAAVSYIGDEPVFYDDLSVWEHIEFVGRLHETDDWEQHGADLLGIVGLTDRADDLPMTFSRGLKQKAAIVLSFVRPFELLVVDEPFVGLDKAGREALLELFRHAHRDGAALLVATHDLVTLSESGRLVALRDGEMVYDGTPALADLDDLVGR
jgi:ABC-2 type transport system ATP-binding protein